MSRIKSPIEKEWLSVVKQEEKYLKRNMEKKDSKLNQLLEEKVPSNLQSTLDIAFSKAFWVVFEKGTGIIEKTYNRDDLKKTYKVNMYAAQVKGNRKSLKAFSKKASGAGNLNLLISGVSGVGLGLLGVGIPDIVLFTSLMLKSIYEIALSFGFDYKSDNEKRFILLLIQGALATGEELNEINDEINFFISKKRHKTEIVIKDCITNTSAYLSKELLYMKFLQGIPIVGAAGGICDALCMKRIIKYAEMKYRRRFYGKYVSVK